MTGNNRLFVLLCVVAAPLVTLGWTFPSAPAGKRGQVELAVFRGFDLGSLFGGSSSSKLAADETAQERERARNELLELFQSSQKVKRSAVEEKIQALAAFSPVKETAASPLLQKEWNLLWTTEKEINFFLDFGLASAVSQTINGVDLGNTIAFKRGGGLFVKGTLSIPDPSGMRTEFKFDTATLDLAKWGSYDFPPVGEGWFDTIYLDDSLRVDTNSRDDILICTPA